MDIEVVIRSRGGVMHRRALRELGCSPYRVRKALAEGRVRAVGRDRLAVSDCAEPLLAAARAGARLSCVSAAAHSGLWVYRSVSSVHVAAGHGFSLKPKIGPGLSSELVIHRAKTPVPVARDDAIDLLPNALVHITSCQPLELAVAIIDSALNKRLISDGALREMAPWQSHRFRKVISLCDGRSDAGNESVLRVRLLASGIPVRIQVVVDRHPVDALIGERMVVQTDGFLFHGDPVRRARDLRQDAALRMLGYTILRFTALHVLNDWAFVEGTIRSTIAQGLHRWS
jgi:very-short-patch-repair endonuclease